MCACLRRLPHQERRIVHKPAHDIRVSRVFPTLSPRDLFPQHSGVDFEFEFVLGRDAGGFDFGQVDGVGEVFIAEAVFAALRRGGFVVSGRLDELSGVDVGGEVDFEVHGDAAVVWFTGVLDV